MGKFWVYSNEELQVRVVQLPRKEPLLQCLKEGFRHLVRDYTESVQRKTPKYTYLFKKLVRKVAYKWIAVLRAAVNEVDKSATVRIFNKSVELINGSDIYKYLWRPLHKHSSYASAASTR